MFLFAGVGLALCVCAGRAFAGEPIRLTHDGRWKQDPVFLNEGREVVYVDTAKSPNLVLMKLDLETKQSTRLHPQATLPEFKPSFAAKGGSCAFLVMTGNDNLSLYCRLKDQEPRKLALTPQVAWHPSIAPDGRRIVYNGLGQLRSATLTAEGTVARDEAYLVTGGRNDWPAISLDGDDIAFGSSRDGNFEIYVASMEAPAEARRLTHSPSLDMRPAWSPDGKRLAFTSLREGNLELFVMNRDGSGTVRVTAHEERDDYASWHPDGRRVVAVSERDGEFDLFLYDVPDAAP